MLKSLVLAAAVFAQQPGEPPRPYEHQQPWDYRHYDDRTRAQEPRESELERERRQYQERHPELHHCRLPACSTR